MKNLQLTLSAVAALLVAGASPAMAADHRGGGERPSFAELDADGSGEVTAAEMAAAREARFAEIDANGDGSVDRAEFLAHAQARAGDRAGAMFDRLDADGDGVLPRDLLALRGGPDPERMIRRLDTDGSGGVSAEEFKAGRERMASRHGGGHSGKGGFFGRAQ